MNKGMTVRQLFEECKKQIKKGNGDKHVLISDDDEANRYHTLFYGFQDNEEDLKIVLDYEHDHHELKEIVALG